MKSHKIALLFINLSIMLSSAVFAQIEASPEATLKSSPIITVSYIFQLFISLLIVFSLMYLIYKYVLPRLNVTSKSKLIEVVDRVGLEPQVAAYIIKVKDSSWLVVASNKNVSVISKIEV